MAILIAGLPVAAGCGGAAGLTPSASMTTTVQGWEHWLGLDWAAHAQPGGQEIDGYVYSKHGSPIVDVQLLAQALDGSGNIVGQKIEWVPGDLPGLQRQYFRIPGLPAAQSYRVSVWAFNVVQSKSFP